MEQDYLITFNWTHSGNKHTSVLLSSCAVVDLKNIIQTVIMVQPERQKLIGLAKASVKYSDESLLSEVIAPGVDVVKFMVMGSQEAVIQKVIQDSSDLDDDDVVNDLDWQYDPGEVLPAFKELTNIASLNNLVKANISSPIHLINPMSQPQKKLIVFDLDYTLFDCKSTVNHIDQLARPGLHDMLSILYPHYDFCIWSQTSWRWLEAKITELGMLHHPDYSIAFVLDQTKMFSIMGNKKGQKKKHQVKPLDYIWKKLPLTGPHNTIHIDDLSRNFAMNPQSGLKISAFKNAPVSRATDRELGLLTKYLLQISLVDDFNSLDHSNWKRYDGPLPPPS